MRWSPIYSNSALSSTTSGKVMDINVFRGILSVILMIAFGWIVFWAYSKHQKKSFDEAANLPFADDKAHEASQKNAHNPDDESSSLEMKKHDQ